MPELRSTKSLDLIELDGSDYCFDPCEINSKHYFRVTPQFVSWASRCLSAASGQYSDPDASPDYIASLGRLWDIEAWAVRKYGRAAVDAAKLAPARLPEVPGSCPFVAGKTGQEKI